MEGRTWPKEGFRSVANGRLCGSVDLLLSMEGLGNIIIIKEDNISVHYKLTILYYEFE